MAFVKLKVWTPAMANDFGSTIRKASISEKSFRTTSIQAIEGAGFTDVDYAVITVNERKFTIAEKPGAIERKITGAEIVEKAAIAVAALKKTISGPKKPG